MKNVLMSLVSLMTVAMMAAPAQADVAGVAWTCQIEADLDGFEGGFIIVVKSFEGRGEMRCQAVTGHEYRTFPIAIDIKGAGVGFGVSVPNNLRFVTGDLGVTSPSQLYGRYNLGVSADGTLIDIGGSVGVNVSFSRKGLALRGVLASQEADGLMGAITGASMTIRPLR